MLGDPSLSFPGGSPVWAPGAASEQSSGLKRPAYFSLKLRIWWSGQSAGNLLSKEGRAPQRLHARTCSTDSSPLGQNWKGTWDSILPGATELLLFLFVYAHPRGNS